MACTALLDITATERERERGVNITAAAGRGERIPNDVRGGGTYLAEGFGVFEFSATMSVGKRLVQTKGSVYEQI